MKKITLAVLLVVFVSTPALADNTGKFYIAGDLGPATYTNQDPFPNPGVIRIAAGIHASRAMAIEIGYSMFGDSTVTDPFGSLTISVASFQVAAVGSLPLNDQFDLIGKIGLAQNSKEYNSCTGLYSGCNGSYSQSDLLFGLGAQYHVNSQVSLRAQYDNYGKFDDIPPEMKATSITVGVAFNF